MLSKEGLDFINKIIEEWKRETGYPYTEEQAKWLDTVRTQLGYADHLPDWDKDRELKAFKEYEEWEKKRAEDAKKEADENFHKIYNGYFDLEVCGVFSNE